jgi:hypothetical protein
MKTLLAALALTAVSLTGCTPASNVEIIDALTISSDNDITGHSPITGDGGWRVKSQTVDHGTHTETRYPNGVTVSAATLDR